jgi:hypothetical protein
MASLAIQIPGVGILNFDEVEQDVTLVDRGVRFANRLSTIGRLLFKAAALTCVFHMTVQKQGELVAALMRIQGRAVDEAILVELADRIEKLVALNDELLTAAPARFAPWRGYFLTIAQQRESLDSMVETFRMGADHHVRECIAALATQAEAESSEEAAESDWREFVASLHD